MAKEETLRRLSQKEALSDSTNEKNSRTDELIKHWHRFARQEFIIAKRLRESEKLLSTIFFYFCEIKRMEEKRQGSSTSISISKSPENKDRVTCPTAEKDDYDFNYAKYSTQIKKSLYSVALLLGVNVELVSESSVSSTSKSSTTTKSHTLDNYIRKIHHELVAMDARDPTATTAASSLIPFYVAKQIDPNSITLLNFVYENLKAKFQTQFTHFKLQKKLILGSASFASDRPLFNTAPNTMTAKAPTSDKDQRSSNNTTSLNDYDDSSTYLFDSPTISLESNEDNADKKTKKKSETISSGSNASNVISIRRLVSCGGDDDNNNINSNIDADKPTTSRRVKSLSPAKTDKSFDDSLCVKIMQNYIDIFGKKDHFNNEEINEEDN